MFDDCDQSLFSFDDAKVQGFQNWAFVWCRIFIKKSFIVDVRQYLCAHTRQKWYIIPAMESRVIGGFWIGYRCCEVSLIGSNGGCVVLFYVKKCLFSQKFLVMTKIMLTFGVIFILKGILLLSTEADWLEFK